MKLAIDFGRAFPATYRRVFRQAYFPRFWIGAVVSAIGDAMSLISIAWLAMELAPGNKGLALALANAAYVVPGSLVALAAGRRLDAIGGRNLLLIDSITRSAVLVFIAALHWSHRLQLAGYIALLSVAALARPIGLAGERVLVRDIIAADHWFSANSLLGLAIQIASIIGPALGGGLIVLIGAANVIAVDGLSFAFFAGVLLTVPPYAPGRVAEPTRLPKLRMRQFLTLKAIVGLFALTYFFHLFYGPFAVALPLYAESLSRSWRYAGSMTLGLLWSAFGLGFLVGGFVGGTRRSLAVLRIAVAIVTLWGVAVALLGTTLAPLVAIAAMAFGGFVYGPYPAIASTILQRESPVATLAQVSTYWSLMTSVAHPSGALLASLLVPNIGARWILLGSGLATILTGGVAGVWTRNKEAG